MMSRTMGSPAGEQDGELEFAGPAIASRHHMQEPNGLRSLRRFRSKAGTEGTEAGQGTMGPAGMVNSYLWPPTRNEQVSLGEHGMTQALF